MRKFTLEVYGDQDIPDVLRKVAEIMKNGNTATHALCAGTRPYTVHATAATARLA